MEASQQFPNNLPPTWKTLLSPLTEEKLFKDLTLFLKNEIANGKRIYPESRNILRALQSLDLPEVKVVILGQDPYHGEGQAIGYSFAVPNELKPKPPSLQNIFKELQSDLGISSLHIPSDLQTWVNQGVLLLNTVLTVEAGKALSHRDKGWEHFTEKVLLCLGERTKPIVFILWGSQAQKFKRLIKPHHFVIESPHPSPLSAHRGFLGSKPFSKTNQFLKSIGESEIRWV